MKHVLNDEGDRLLGIIFSSLTVEEYLKHFNQKDFNIAEKSFVKKLVDKYTSKYPSNYNNEEVEIIFGAQFQKIQEKYPVQEYNTKRIGFSNIINYYADKVLEHDNKEIKYCFNEIFDWEGYRSKIGEEVFACAYISQHGREIEPYYERHVISSNNERLNRILKEGISENHMHLKASGYSLEFIWQNLVISKKSAYIMDLKKINYRKRKEIESEFKKYDNYKYYKRMYTHLDEIKQNNLLLFHICIAKIIRDFLHANVGRTIETKYAVILLNNIKKAFEKIENDSEILTPTNINDQLEYVFDKLDSDGLGSRSSKFELFESQETDPKNVLKAEREFIYEQFNILNTKNSEYEFLLFLYLKIKNDILFKEYVQPNDEVSGFSEFKKYEDRKLNYVPETDKEDIKLFESVFHKYQKEFGQKIQLEIKIAPKSSKKGYLKVIKQIDKISKEYNIEYGLIVHFIKVKEKTKNRHRHFDNIKLANKQAQILANLLESNNDEKLVQKIIGIDAANSEFFAPPEAYAQAFRIVNRNRKRRIAKTFHVGEDFTTPLTGIRRIWEAYYFLEMTRGNRMGHAIALGIDLDTYYKVKKGKITTTNLEYLDDLVWLRKNLIHYKYKNSEYTIELEKIIKRKLTELCNEIGNNKDYISINDYTESMLLRGESVQKIHKFEEKISENDFLKIYQNGKNECKIRITDCERHTRACKNKKARELFHYYMLDYEGKNDLGYYFDKKYITEVTPEYIEAVKFVQEMIKRELSEIGIAIETNPTSNKKISYIEYFKDSPVFNFNMHGITSANNTTNIPISINTDDSAIFNASLVNEYALIFNALKDRENISDEEIYQYIEYLRKLSLQTSFLEYTDKNELKIKALKKQISELKW